MSTSIKQRISHVKQHTSSSSQDKITACFKIKTKNLELARQAFVYGQSIGNPTLRTPWDKKLSKHLIEVNISEDTDSYLFDVTYPLANFSPDDGISYILSVLMGGQTDIDAIEACRLVYLDLGPLERNFLGPRYGINGVREFLDVKDRALVGGIIKPKIGLHPEALAFICREMVEGGIDFIKEDEILSNQEFAPVSKRVKSILKVLKPRTIYAPCITGDGSEVIKKAMKLERMGVRAVHLNVWCGLGIFNELRRRTSLMIFFQKSGEKVWSTGPFSIDFSVLCYLINLIGCDFTHIGMFGGYLSETTIEIGLKINNLRDTIPSFSCGMTPERARTIVKLFGKNVMVTSGGWIHSQTSIRDAVRQMRNAVEDL